MVDHRIGGLPVVDGDERVIGVITETDIFRAFVERERRRAAAGRELRRPGAGSPGRSTRACAGVTARTRPGTGWSR